MQEHALEEQALPDDHIIRQARARELDGWSTKSLQGCGTPPSSAFGGSWTGKNHEAPAPIA